jgi:predicted secreted protein
MSDAISGKGTILKYAAGTTVGELSSITGPSIAAETIDVTSHESADGFREFIGGLRDGGEISIEGNFIQDDAGQLALLASLNSGAVESFVILFTDSAQFAMSGIVTAFEVGAPMDDKISFSATIKISGKPVFTGATTLRTVTFTVTAAVGGAAIEAATVVFNNETKATNASGVAVFTQVADGVKVYGVYKATYVGESAPITVNGDESEAVTLALA